MTRFLASKRVIPNVSFLYLQKHQNSDVFRQYRNITWQTNRLQTFILFCGITKVRETVLITFFLAAEYILRKPVSWDKIGKRAAKKTMNDIFRTLWLVFNWSRELLTEPVAH